METEISKAFKEWVEKYQEEHKRADSDWYPQPSTFESFIAGYLAAKEGDKDGL